MTITIIAFEASPDEGRGPAGGDDHWLDGEFSAGDLMMVMVLRRADAHLLAEYPTLAAYVARGEARPAYQRAFADQLALFTDRQKPGNAR